MKFKIFIQFVLCFLFVFICFEFIHAQSSQQIPDTTQTPTISDSTSIESEITNISQIGSLWDLTKLAGIFRWFIFATLFIGFLLVVYEMLKLIKDKRNSRDILSLNFKEKNISEIKSIIISKKESFIKNIGTHLIDVFEKTGNVEGFAEEVTSSIRTREKKFGSFTTTINFLSDTAGALGLLGTIWGMFVTFFSETWDTTTILRGMGIALVTTLMGLIVSIILNFCSTIVFRFFNQGLEKSISKADELRLLLISQKVIEYVPIKSIASDNQSIQLKLENEKIISGIVNRSLDEPVRIKLLDKNGSSIFGQKIKFELIKGDAFLKNGKKVMHTPTDSNGVAEINFTLGEKINNYLVRCTADELSTNSRIDIKVFAKAGPPKKITKISKQLDYVPINKKLSSPLIVQLFDQFDNPISNHKIIFIVSGNGHFEQNQQKISVVSDTHGKASAYFFAGTKSEINNISVKAEGLDDQVAEFKIMSVEK